VSGREGDDGVNEPTRERSKGLPSGIVTVRSDVRTGKAISVYDISTGRVLDSAALPAGYGSPRREQFDPTMRRFADVMDCALIVSTLTDDHYVPTAQWKPPQSYGQGKQCFNQPRFTKDGRVRARVAASDHEAGRVVSVDPDKPEAPPPDEGAGVERDDLNFQIASRAGSEVGVWARGTEIDSVWVTGSIAGADLAHNTFDYKCDWPIDEVTYTCASSYGKERQPYGSVAIVKVDLASRTVTMKQVAPASGSTGITAIASPDGKRVAIKDSTGWYIAAADGTSVPRRQPLSDIPDTGDIIFWH
jgi:hypothetical protein